MRTPRTGMGQRATISRNNNLHLIVRPAGELSMTPYWFRDVPKCPRPNSSPSWLSVSNNVFRIRTFGELPSVLLLSGSAMIASAPSFADEDTPAGAVPRRTLRTGSSAMQASVLALNRHFVPVHLFSSPRAFCLLCKGMAEVVNVEEGRFATLDFEAWREHSQLKLELGLREPHEDWIQAVHFEIEVPRVIRLLKYDRVPRNSVKYNRPCSFFASRAATEWQSSQCCTSTGRIFCSKNWIPSSLAA